MKRVLLGMVLGLGLSPSAGCAAGISPASALPPGSHLLIQTAIAGHYYATAVAYISSRPFVGVVLQEGSRKRLMWSSMLPASPRRLLSPGPSGAFIVYASAAHAVGSVSVYRLHNGRVSWALVPGKGRPLPASSVHAGKRTLTVMAPDTSHVGSVHYRYRTSLAWTSSSYGLRRTVHEPDIPPQSYPVPNGVVHLRNGDTVLMKLETAWTLQEQEHGLMNRKSLDPDSGMIFVWPNLVDYTFYMENTLIPLTVAFLAPDGRILDLQDMAAMDSTTLHSPDLSRCATPIPGQCYQFAIEMNKGFFANSGIQIGDTVRMSLPCGSFPGFHSASAKCYS